MRGKDQDSSSAYGNESDEGLMIRARSGDKDAFAELVRRYGSKMVNLAYRIIGDREIAEDVAQETFLRAYQSAPRYQTISKFSTWLHTIAINLCRNELKRRRNQVYSLEGMAQKDDEKMRIDIADHHNKPDILYERKEIERIVLGALESLPEHFRLPLVLRDIQGLTYEEIEEILGIPQGTVKSRINRARLRVKEMIEPFIDPYSRGSRDGL